MSSRARRTARSSAGSSPNSSPSASSPDTPFILPACLRIETVEQLLADLRERDLTGGATVVLDASDVESITTPAAQILLSLQRTLAEQDGSYALRHAKPHVAQALRDLGLSDLID